MLLNPSPICSSRFVLGKDKITFIAEASDLGRSFSLGRVYDDACDEGFTIISKRTGKPAVFALYNHEEDGEGDLVSWIFKCVTPGLKHLKAVIYND
jgi:hypothetical protein